QELIAIPAELSHLVRDLAGHLVDSHEEGHLALAKRVQNLSLPADHPEDRLSVRLELHRGQVIVQPDLLVEVLPCPADPLERHPSVEQRLHDLQGHEITEGIHARDARAASGLLNGWTHQPYLIPVPQLPRGASGEARSLMCRETLQRRSSPRPSVITPAAPPDGGHCRRGSTGGFRTVERPGARRRQEQPERATTPSKVRSTDSSG